MPPLGPPVLLASGRVGRQIAQNRSDKPVYLDSEHKLVCLHGERAPSLMAWLAAERADPSYTRPSSGCDCTNIDGLMSEYAYDPTDDPNLPSSLYELLGALGAEQKTVMSRPQRKAFASAESEVWVQPTGTIVCAHGNSDLRKGCAKNPTTTTAPPPVDAHLHSCTYNASHPGAYRLQLYRSTQWSLTT